MKWYFLLLLTFLFRVSVTAQSQVFFDYDKKANVIKIFDVTPPVKIIPIGKLDICIGGSVVLTSSLSGRYLWSTSDTTKSITVKQAGTYSIKYTDSLGHFNTASIQVTQNSNPLPVPKFNINNSSQCFKINSFNFTNVSTISSGAFTSSWDLGDNTKDTSKNITGKKYSGSSTYSIKLKLTSAIGCKDSLTKTIKVNPEPVAGFSISNTTQCISGNSFVFTNSSSISSGTLTYKWVYGDGNTSTTTSPSYSYNSPGGYSVKLVNTSNNGCKDSISKSLSVYYKPVISFSINDPTQCVGSNFVFTNNSSVTNSTLTHKWSFGDGRTSTTTSPSNNYASAGFYTVKLVSTSAFGCKDSITKKDTVYYKPTVSFTINNPTQCVGSNFVFTNNSSVTNSTLTHKWSFGDGRASTTTSPSNNYASAGFYTVKLVSTSAFGCKDSITKKDTVYYKPTVSFTINDPTQCVGSNFVFTNNSSVTNSTLTHKWSFGNGRTSKATSPTNNYTSAGFYTVKLVSTSAFGCKDSTTRNDTVYYKPVVNFTINDPTQCVGSNFVFTNNSSVTNSNLTHKWSFGDGRTSTTTSPTNNYASAGFYTIKLVSTSGFGCKDSITKKDTVYYKPTVSFTINDPTQCVGSNFVFTNNSSVTNSNLTHKWSFGDGRTSTTTSPSNNYASAGFYTVKLVSTSAFGCKDSTTRNDTVYYKPVVNFTINNPTQCVGSNFVFTNNSSVTNSTLTHKWSFGDGRTSTTTSPSNNYASAGFYTVKLVSTSAFGCKDSITKKDTVNYKPTVSFTINDPTQCVGSNFVFTNNSSVTNSTLTHKWSFGDGRTSTTNSPSNNYASAGFYTVKLVSTSGFGCKDSITKKDTVYYKPSVSFTINDPTQCVGSNFVYTNNSSVTNSTLTHKWGFGDGRTSTTTSPTNNYASAGFYNVKLVSTSAFGCKDSITKNDTVFPGPVPNFAINNSSQCLSGNSFVFTNSSSLPTGSMNYKWSFGDGNGSNSQNPSYSYGSVGFFSVKLVSTSNNGCKDSISKSITIFLKPSVSFTLNDSTQCLSGNNFVFTNTGSITGGSLSHKWTFGDGSNSTNASPSHSYSNAGNNTIQLVSTSNNGCVDSFKKTITVYHKPVVSFTVNDSTQCASDNNFVFTNNSTVTSSTLTYKWSFGDGKTSSSQNPSHSYASPGGYIVKLISTSAYGCKDSIIKADTVFYTPVVSFTIDDPGQCENGNSFVFTNNSSVTNSNLTHQWNFGDGGTSTSTSPTKTYGNSGFYNVKLISTSAYGCKDSLTKADTVFFTPVVNFAIDDPGQCLKDNSFVFTNNSSVTNSNLTHQWNFGDGGTSTSNSPTKTYSNSGFYNVKLISTSAYGCRDSLTKADTVFYTPVVNFTIDDPGQCLNGNSLVFTNNSSVTNSTLTHQWNFGDGGTSTSTSPTKTYGNSGFYTVKLISTSAFGCKDSLTKADTVFYTPVVNFSISDPGQCENDNSFVFTNNSSVTNSTLTHQWNFGDGGTSTSISPTNSYSNSGFYIVKLISTSAYGCRDSLTKVDTVFYTPVVNFTIDDLGQCLKDNSFVFTNSSSVTNSTLTHQWNFGDGRTSTSTSPTKTYSKSGFYNVKLISISAYGCRDSITKADTVFYTPVVSFTIGDPGQCLKDNSFVFTNNSSVTKSTLTHHWNFGDGGISTSTNPTKTYSTSGFYNVKLISTSAYGCKDSLTKVDTVFYTPVVSFTIGDAGQCLKENNFVFTNNSSVTNSNLTHRWNFGDGGTSTSISPTKTYSNSGFYNVKLISASAYGCRDSLTKADTVFYTPVVNFNIDDPGQCLKENSFVFNNYSSVTNSTLTYQWNFGDGGTSTGISPTKTYSNSGFYNVKLISTSAYGCRDSLTQADTVFYTPVVSFSIDDPGQCLKDNIFVFTNNSSVTNSTLTHSWNFGDGGTSTSTSPTKTYSNSGFYNIKLISTSSYGCKDSLTKADTVFYTPVVNFTIVDPGQCENGNNFVFTNNSSVTKSTLTHHWNFGDGGISTSTNPTKTYSTSGFYNVKLISTSAYGCKDSLTKADTVFYTPVVNFTIDDPGQCENGNIFGFTNSSSVTNSTLTHQWNFGDGGTSTSNNPTKNYSTSGFYNVKLISASAYGCRDSLTKADTVFYTPVVNFNIDDPGQCLKENSFVFNNYSSVTNSTLTHKWNFGDGGTSTSTNPTKTYSNSGFYNVKLISISAYGCRDSLTQVDTVFYTPVVNFTIDNPGQCLKDNSFVFTNNSSVTKSTLTHRWNFGDGGTSTSTSPTKTYSTSGFYNVKLISTSAYGCRDSLTKADTVFYTPVVNFTIDNPGQCLKDNNFVFTNNSSVNNSTLTHKWNFGDGGTSTITSPTKTYSTSGFYNVKLISTSAYGCRDSLTKADTVFYTPVVNFTLDNPGQCLKDNSFVFTNNSSVTNSTLTHQWSFGDGRTSTSNSPSNNYASAGFYTVKLISTSTFGCKDSLTKADTVFYTPVVNFSISDPGQCENDNNFVFTNNSSVNKSTLMHQWNFGDGGTSTSTSPTKTYNNSGFYNVKLISTSAYGCRDSLTKADTVFYTPVVNFTIDNPGQCLKDNSFVFTNNSSVTYSTLTQQWNFGDGGTSTNTSPSKTYSNSGFYNVKLISTSAYGCKDSLTKADTVFYTPVVNFTIDDPGQCENGNNFVFTNNSSVNKSTLTHQWNFGDGGTSTSTSPTKTYSTSGFYNVKLISTSAYGCRDSLTKADTVFYTPVVNFTIDDPGQCLKDNSFVFTNNSSVTNSTLTHKWSFGDGRTSTSISPSNNYASAGFYSVKLISTSAFGCKDSLTKADTVYYTPVVNFSISNPSQCLKDNSFVFTNNSSVTYSTLTHQWNFGDGGTSTSTSPTKTYGNSGFYNVKLISTSAFGCKDSLTKADTVFYTPVVNFAIDDPGQCLKDNSFVFTNNSSVTNSTLTHQWNFGDGRTSTSTSPTKTYGNSGFYNVRLISTSAYGCIDSLTQADTVFYTPVVNFTIGDPGQCLKDNSFVFTNNSSVTNSTLTHQWSFGDGGTSTSISPTKIYLNSGFYKVKLISTSAFGCKDSLTQADTVFYAPVVNFTIGDPGQCLKDNSFVFTNNSSVTNSTLTHQWNFGDGGTSTSTSPTKTYSTSGFYNVKLISTSAYGCRDSLTKADTVYYTPVVNFTIDNPGQCLKDNSFVFTNNSSVTNSTLTHQWNFGDGGTSTSTNPTKTYSNSGFYNVKLISTSAYGCRDSLSKADTVFYAPVVNFTIGDPGQCLKDNSFVFTNNSSVTNSTLTHKWNFGDGGTSTSTNPTKTYSNSGFYNVILISTSAYGCRDSLSKADTVFYAPVVNFTIGDPGQCLKDNSFVFTNNSSVTNSTLTHKWNFGDGGTSTSTNPTKTYSKSGFYNVKLISTSAYGCRDSLTQVDTVYNKPIIGFTINNPVQCLNSNLFSLIDSSTIASGNFTRKWFLGDGNVDTSKIINAKRYPNARDYKIGIVLTSNYFCKDSIFKTITINPNPISKFTLSDTSRCLNGNIFKLTNKTFLVSGTKTYFWDFGDSTIDKSLNPNKVYTNDGSYKITLIAISNKGCRDTFSEDVTVYPSPQADFSIVLDKQCKNGNSFDFINKTYISSGAIHNLWDHGDGTQISTHDSKNKHYSSSGSNLVKLLVTSVNGCKDSISKSIQIHDSPSAKFYINDDSQCYYSQRFSFANASSLAEGYLNYVWYFGDGTQDSSVEIKSKKYSDPYGTYNVKLVAESSNGCKDSAIQSVTVHSQATVKFSVNDSSQCFRGNNFVLKNHSIINKPDSISSYMWKFGDGSIETKVNTFHSFKKSGNYSIKLVTTSDKECKDSSVQNITVYPNVEIDFTIDDTTQCLSNNLFNFIDSSNITEGTFSLKWLFGDGDTALVSPMKHNYKKSGIYLPRIVLLSDEGCRDTLTRLVEVYPQPIASFEINDSTQCFQLNKFDFNNTSTISSGNINYIWKFGDKKISSQLNPSHQYTNTGMFKVGLKATSNFGCVDSVLHNIKIFGNPPLPHIEKIGVILKTDANPIIQWLRNDTLIIGENLQFLPTNLTGYYQVETTNEFGCVQRSDSFFYDYSGSGSMGLDIFPNPNDGKFTVTTVVPIEEIEIFDSQGKLILTKKYQNVYIVNLNENFSIGNYIVRVRANQEVVNRKVEILK
jgi:PKD repeat protein